MALKAMKTELIYPELSYQIVGILFEVYNSLGPGLHEKYYQKSLSVGLKNKNLNFKEQVFTPLIFQDNKVGSYFLDFLVESKIALEIKKGDRFSRNNIEQVFAYLKNNDLKLGILANFGRNELKYKRIINLD